MSNEQSRAIPFPVAPPVAAPKRASNTLAPEPPPDFLPIDVGLPPKFSTWRPGQFPALMETLSSPARFKAHSAPTGWGKSVFYVATGLLSGARTGVLTATKALQDQNIRDFSPCGMVDVRGSSNYPCSVQHGATCNEGRPLGCQDPGCQKADAVQKARAARLFCTNYDSYFYAYSNPNAAYNYGELDTLVLDEGHAVVDEMCDFLTVKLDHSYFHQWYEGFSSRPPYTSTYPPEWREWANHLKIRTASTLSQIKESQEKTDLDELRPLVALDRALSKLLEASDDWLIQHELGTSSFSPIWPDQYTEKYLFNKVKNVVILSATLVEKSLHLLGIPSDPTQTLFLQHPYTFDPRRAPIYLFGNASLSHKSPDSDYWEQSGRMDTLISQRLDRKGIIHCHSYAFQRGIVSRSQYSGIMLAPESSRDLPTAIAEFLASPPPRILISPSITTGYDFPLSACEYQFIAKWPFIDGRPAITAARQQSDPEYLPYLIAQRVVQACGRAMRGPRDQCETFIMDRQANWFLTRDRTGSDGKKRGGYAHLFPSWFLRQIFWNLDGPPSPPPPLGANLSGSA